MLRHLLSPQRGTTTGSVITSSSETPTVAPRCENTSLCFSRLQTARGESSQTKTDTQHTHAHTPYKRASTRPTHLNCLHAHRSTHTTHAQRECVYSHYSYNARRLDCDTLVSPQVPRPYRPTSPAGSTSPTGTLATSFFLLLFVGVVRLRGGGGQRAKARIRTPAALLLLRCSESGDFSPVHSQTQSVVGANGPHENKSPRGKWTQTLSTEPHVQGLPVRLEVDPLRRQGFVISSHRASAGRELFCSCRVSAASCSCWNSTSGRTCPRRALTSGIPD